MKKVNSFLPIFCIALAACGGGAEMAQQQPGFVQLPFAPVAGSSAAPGPNFDINDEVGFSFDLFAGQVNDTGGGGAMEAETILTQAVLNADSVTQVTLKAPSGNVFVFELDRIDTTSNTNFDEYFYITDDKTYSMRIKRFNNGGNQAILKEGDFDVPSPLRASFAYGWRTDLNAVTPDTGTTTATYRGFGSSEFFLSSGERALSGDANLTVDFSAKTVDGILFNNIGKTPEDGINAVVAINNGTLNNDGTIAATDALTATFTDSRFAVTSPVVNNSSEVLGQLSGDDAATIGGGFAGTIDATRSGIGAQNLGYSGVFRAARQ